MWRYRIWSLASWWLVKCSTVCHCESLAPLLRRCTAPNWGGFTTSYRTSKSASSALDAKVRLAEVMWAAVLCVSISPVLFTRRSCRGKADMRRKAAGLVSMPSETWHKTTSSWENLRHHHFFIFQYIQNEDKNILIFNLFTDAVNSWDNVIKWYNDWGKIKWKYFGMNTCLFVCLYNYAPQP